MAATMPAIVARFVDCHVFRIGADGRDEWLVLRRAPHVRMPGAWAPVQGHIEPGEKAYEAAARELAEETGLHPLAFWQASYVNRFYIADRDEIIFSPVFCAQAAADAPVTLCDEHTDHRWVSAAEAMSQYVWPGQRKSLKICREQFVLGTPRDESRLDALLGTGSGPGRAPVEQRERSDV
jgi:dATP pyrophosphohydrolase